jgi:phosphoribosylformylglycinamidine synthase PurS subunit
MVSEEHITAFGWATPQDLDDIVNLAIRVNDFLSGLFLGVGIKLVDFKLEFGRLWENDMVRIVLADEISPDNCRLWDVKTGEKLDKDRFRRDMGGVIEAYSEVARRLGIIVLDPQGKAIEGALKSLGIEGVESVRQGKVFEIELADGDKTKAEAALKAAADKLLANTVVENYRVEVLS